MQVNDWLKVVGFVIIYILLIFSISASSYHILSTNTTQQIFDDNTVSQFNNLKIIGNLIVNDNVTINTLSTNNINALSIEADLLKTESFVFQTVPLTNTRIATLKIKTQFMQLQLNSFISKTFDFTVPSPVYNVVFPFGLLLNQDNIFTTGTSTDHFVLESESAPNFNGTFAKFNDTEIWLMSCLLSIDWGLNSGLFVTPISASISAVAVDETIQCTTSRSTSVLSFQNTSLSQINYCLNDMIFETPLLNVSGNNAPFIGLGIPISYDPIASKGKVGKITISSLNITFRRLL